MSVGYHVDDQKFAPNGWLTAADWDWTKLFPDLVTQAMAGTYKPAVSATSGSRMASSVSRPYGTHGDEGRAGQDRRGEDKDVGHGPVPGLHRPPIKDQAGR